MNAFVSADGKMLYLQDKAIKYNDFMASMVNMPASQPNMPNGMNNQMGGNLARYYEIPFRNILESMAQ